MFKFISGLALYFQSGTQDVEIVVEQTRNERLPELWFADIPHCTLRCIYPLALECGCAYSDFQCICGSIGEITADETVEACITQCPQNEDQRYAPSRILDFCELLGVEVHLPEYMDQFSHLHRRQSVGAGDPGPEETYSYTYYYSEYPYEPTSAYSETSTSVAMVTESDITVEPTSAYSETSTPVATVIEPGFTVEPTETGAITETATNGITPGPTNTSASDNNGSDGSSSSSSGDLSTGATAGIGVAVPLAVIILSLFIFWFLRKRKAAKNNNQIQYHPDDNNNGGDLPEVGEEPKKAFLPFGGRFEADGTSLPVETDGNALNESDSRSILPTPRSQNNTAAAPIYELSGNSAATPVRPALAPHRGNQSLLNRQYSETSSTANISRKAVGSPIPRTESEDASGVAPPPNIPSDNDNNANDALISPQPSEKHTEQHTEKHTEQHTEQHTERQEQETASTARTLASVEQNDLHQLEEEMARVRAQRERLQHLQLLEEREEQLKKQIAARKAGSSRE